MNKTILLALLPVLVCCTAQARPGPRGVGIGPGVGMGDGYLSIDSSLIDFGNNLNGYGLGLGFGSKLGDNVGFIGEIAGFNINDHGYADSSRFTADGGGYQVSIGPELYLTPNLSLFATAGFIHYSMDYAYASGSDSGAFSDTTGVFGGGLRLSFGPNVSLKLAYKTFETDNLTISGDNDSSVVSLGIGFRF
ncbi:porin family protein [Vibrio sp. JC009]|uniref:outer membrane beta-barrel protein n=1 Tax=Vibrio sp. JC009 TaxID=2912314 RepID=UPI0023B0B0C4|nr:outer membrane beta-barrel protein [Vibrio sp. JC009]WED22851.1 porin family protein [Vibrio sp. JC009]